jgi:hypothetical protein
MFLKDIPETSAFKPTVSLPLGGPGVQQLEGCIAASTASTSRHFVLAEKNGLKIL